MAEIVYALCALLSVGCAVMLGRGYRQSKSTLLLWSCLCFSLLGLNNLLLFVDMILLPDINFDGSFWRNLMAAGAGSVLIFGLIWEIT